MATNLPSAETAAAFEKVVLREAGAGGTGDPADYSQSGSLQKEEDAEKNPAKGLPEEYHEYVTGIKLILIMIPTTLVYFLLMLDGSIVSTAIPTITSEFDSLLDIGWYVLTYIDRRPTIDRH
jgi:hypothetical protein